jgi:uncharacterized protein
MIFVDTNVFMFAVGHPHPLQSDARRFFKDNTTAGTPLVTSVEVLQELLHAYIPVRRQATLERAWELAESATTVWDLEDEDLRQAKTLAARHVGLSARDLLHIACCRRRKATGLHTYDRKLREAWEAA